MKQNILGIDIGSVAVALALLDKEGRTRKTVYRFHDGRPRETLTDILSTWTAEAPAEVIGSVAATTSAASMVTADRVVDDRVAAVAEARKRHGVFGSLLAVGGEKFGLLSFSADGSYDSYKGQTACAAGTGGFLDQQAERLGLPSSAELSRLAESNQSERPRIATRCAVFAKTDLIHAQQEGHSLEAIADGLCEGLARNLLDTVTTGGTPPAKPLIISGGVALNAAVVRHIGVLTGTDPVVDSDAPLYGALGAARTLAEDPATVGDGPAKGREVGDIIRTSAPTSAVENPNDLRYPPLTLELSPYPDFQCLDEWEYPIPSRKGRYPVEVEIFEALPASGAAVLGLDIGSTSTKAILLGDDHTVLLGLYTRTAGRPVEALQGLFRALDDAMERYGSGLEISAAATTGSGRRLVGEIVGADLVLDEITAHARAAYELDPEVDTIIEIGGQDAKFTTLSMGRVTSSIMNNVCAAGTGSFLEEQAARLGHRVVEYADLTEGIRAPLSSDRCTVFMQRDLNHLLAEGSRVPEVLASALHSVRENYLNKVAVRNRIGSKVFFQGATARIKTLVAAFEQDLEKPILVSRYCRHTGAMGAALTLLDGGRIRGTFRGIDLWRRPIPVRTEICEICRNACKITLAEVGDETVAYGFLCGRDYGTDRYVATEKKGFDPFRERREVYRVVAATPGSGAAVPYTMGLPAALYLTEEMPFWEKFFSLLGIPTVVDVEGDPMDAGKSLSRAEFCAPMTALHGRVGRLLSRSDFVFLPFYLENERIEKDRRRKLCYYSQYAPVLAGELGEGGRIITPLVKSIYTDFHAIGQVHEALSRLPGNPISFRRLTEAWDLARNWFDEKKEQVSRLHEKRRSRSKDDVNVVLLGRPYTVLDEDMNKGIPGLFEELGVRVFTMDMLREDDGNPVIDDLTREMPWEYAGRILRAAEQVAETPGSYPVLVTSFMCSPDSFVLGYARRLWEERGKPYLVLELDGHGSTVGYGTRIEAAVCAFRNHRMESNKSKPPGGIADPALVPDHARDVRDKTILIPALDPDVVPLLAANLRREGIDARPLEETAELIRGAGRRNEGQCLPLTAIAHEAAAYVRKHQLEPRETVVWMPQGDIACNFTLFPHHIRTILREEGEDTADVQVFPSDVGFLNLAPRAAVSMYFAYMFGGLLKRMGCRIRPYEVNPGETDTVLTMARDRLVETFLGRGDRLRTVREIVDRFEAIPIRRENRPKVAIFGDLYVRDNDVMNQDLIRYIEKHGGEVVTTPYSRYAKMIARSHFRKLLREKRYRYLVGWKVLLQAVKILERSYDKLFAPLADPEQTFDEDPAEILAPYGVLPEHDGESMENLLKIHYLMKRHPDLALFVQTSPSFCCPGIVTEAMRDKIEEVTGVPVVSLTYDGTGGDKNAAVVPYLAFPRKQDVEKDGEGATA